MGRKKKPVVETISNCAWCNKPNKITVTDKIITPAVKAEKERVIKVEKDDQTKVGEFVDPNTPDEKPKPKGRSKKKAII